VTRRRLARDGLVIVALDGRGGAQVHGVGLPLDEDYDDFVAEAESDVAEALRKLRGAQGRDPAAQKEAARGAARRAAQRWAGKRPHAKIPVGAATVRVRAARHATGGPAWVFRFTERRHEEDVGPRDRRVVPGRECVRVGAVWGLVARGGGHSQDSG